MPTYPTNHEVVIYPENLSHSEMLLSGPQKKMAKKMHRVITFPLVLIELSKGRSTTKVETITENKEIS